LKPAGFDHPYFRLNSSRFRALRFEIDLRTFRFWLTHS
jgi:hypothetical protein